MTDLDRQEREALERATGARGGRWPQSEERELNIWRAGRAYEATLAREPDRYEVDDPSTGELLPYPTASDQEREALKAALGVMEQAVSEMGPAARTQNSMLIGERADDMIAAMRPCIRKARAALAAREEPTGDLRCAQCGRVHPNFVTCRDAKRLERNR